MDKLLEMAHRETVTSGTDVIAGYLQDSLGQKLTALIADVGDPKAVGRWAQGQHKPRLESEERLRTAFQVLRILEQAYDVQTARFWFIGMNPKLGEVPPAQALRAGLHQEVLAAAKCFIEGD